MSRGVVKCSYLDWGPKKGRQIVPGGELLDARRGEKKKLLLHIGSESGWQVISDRRALALVVFIR